MARIANRWMTGFVLGAQLVHLVLPAIASTAFADEAGRPSPGEIAAARSAGESAGERDGEREGRARGWIEGVEEGRREGYRHGYDHCLGERKRDSYDHGYADGARDGSHDGQARGQIEGYSQGQNVGYRDGQADGDRRASRQATEDAEAPARAEGRRDADATDSYQRGEAAGVIAGDARARQTAKDTEYPRGQDSYRTQRLNEPISREVSENLSGALRSVAPSSRNLIKNSELLEQFTPENRFETLDESNPYTDPQLRSAYSQGYGSGYRSGYDSAYRQEHRRGEAAGEPEGRQHGCRDAQFVDVSSDFRRGREEGYNRAYRESYDHAYRIAYELGYGPAFRSASDAMYRDRYAGYYQNAYARFRAEAYEARVNQLYRAGYAAAEQATFDRTYPGYAAAEFNRGVADETAEFAANPMSFMESGFREQFQDSVIEPGETIGFWFRVRNFADQELSASELRFEVETSGKGLLPLRQKDVGTVGVPGRGAILMNGAVPVIVSESALNHSVSATVKVFYRGKLLGSKSYSFLVRNRATVEFSERPVIREGLESTLKVKVTNNSSQAITGPVRLELRSDSRHIELRQASAEVATLAPGETRETTFRVVGTSDQDSPQISLAISVVDGARKRVAVRDFSGSVPVVNDYRVRLLDGGGSLKNSGVTRLNYRIRNVSSRLVFGALELYARVLDANGKVVPEARWIGFNPQFLLPLEKGEQVKFVIPVVMPQGVSAGMVELEVRENGVPVVIHQARF
jgi:hypothetical protein